MRQFLQTCKQTVKTLLIWGDVRRLFTMGACIFEKSINIFFAGCVQDF